MRRKILKAASAVMALGLSLGASATFFENNNMDFGNPFNISDPGTSEVTYTIPPALAPVPSAPIPVKNVAAIKVSLDMRYFGALSAKDAESAERSGAYADGYVLKNDTGSCVRIVLAIESGFDSYLIAPLYEGVRYSDDDSGNGLNARIKMNVLASTELNFEVTSYNKSVKGEYELSVENLGSCGDPKSTIDFRIRSPQLAKTEVLAGERFSILAEVMLRGDWKLIPRNGVLISYFLSEDRHLDTSDYLLGNEYLKFENHGMDLSDMFDLSVPEGYAPGMYYVIVKIDSGNEVTESNERNNTAVLPITVTQ
ncbi:MAG: hypothetical protein FE834_07105 [Gammaproteobacteria bacterium]|nr:hypothetical protein [Gammaproteobacteria bacterium]